MTPRCPRCHGPVEAQRDLEQSRCHTCETSFMEEWPPAGVSGFEDLEQFRACWQTARERFMREGTHLKLVE
jgi:hypothetical protein